MMQISVNGIGVIGGFGCGVAALRMALERGTVPVGELSVPTAQGPRLIPAFRAETVHLDEFVPKRSLRRVDRFSRLGLLGAYLALSDGGRLGTSLDRVGVIVASGYGATATTFAFLDSMTADGDICASPTHFANSVHNAAAANISIMLGAKGPSLTVSQFDLSVSSALLTARQWLAEGRVDAVLFGAVDELSDLVAYLQLRRRGVNTGGCVAPLDAGRETSVVGEGAAFLLLTRTNESPAYCAIGGVEVGTLPRGGLQLPEDSLLVLGADGRRELAARYRAVVPEHAPLACYASLYGSLPAGGAFDLAAAALVLQRGEAYPIPGAAGCYLDGTPAPLATGRISVVRLAEANQFTLVAMSGL